MRKSTTRHTMSGTATMTRPSRSRSRGGSADKIWAVGLAGATCVGLVGVVGVRAAQDAAAQTPTPTSASTTTTAASTSLSGLTEAQLDDYAQTLEGERVRLEAYHAELLETAARLQGAADVLNQGRSGAGLVTAPPAAKPLPKPAAAPQVAKPQAQTRGS